MTVLWDLAPRPHEPRESARGKLYRGRGPETWFGFAALHNWALAGKKWEVDANHDKNYREDNELTTEQIMGQLRMADDNILRPHRATMHRLYPRCKHLGRQGFNA